MILAKALTVHPTGRFAAQQWIALGVTAGILFLAVLAAISSGRGKGLLMGQDHRLSTSKTIAVLWTAVVAYCLLSLIFIAVSDFGIAFLKANIGALGGVYLALLGGPFAAFLFAKIAVPLKLENGTLQKTSGDGLNPSDLVRDDTGNTDLVDLQYTIFNLVVMVYVLGLFLPHPGLNGLPNIPDQLAILTGSSAATYVLNKGLSKNAPSISALTPSVQRVGDLVTIRGANLWLPATDAQGKPILPTVSLAGIPGVGPLSATVIPDGDPSAVRFQVPNISVAGPSVGPIDVTLTTPAGRVVTATAGLSIVPDVPRVDQMTPHPANRAAPVQVTGRFLAGPAVLNSDGSINQQAVPAQPEVDLDGAAVPISGVATESGLSFVLPARLTRQSVTIIVRRAGASSGPRTLPVAPPPKLTTIPSEIAFGPVAVNESRDASVTIRNPGGDNLVIDRSDASPPGTELSGGGGMFTIINDPVAGATIPPGGSAPLTVRFQPTAPGDYAATITIRSNTGVDSTIALSGSAP